MKAFRSLLTWCGFAVIASNGMAPLFAQVPGSTEGSKATVIVYRMTKFGARAVDPPVYCDDREMAWMDNGRYFIVKLEPGKHLLRSEDTAETAPLEARAGETYYVEVQIKMGKWKGKGKATLVAKEKGQNDTKKLKPLAIKNVVAAEVLLEPLPKNQ